MSGAGDTVAELGATALSATRAGTAGDVPTATTLARGSLIARFVVLEVLGSGGMGVVYAAYDPQLDRKVAIKLLRASIVGSDEARVRLLREAQAMARIDHPNVLRVHEAGTFDDQVYIAMELAGGGTLRRWLAAETRRPSDIVAVFVDAGSGLAAAHAAGLVHRDFKPDNVLMFADDRVRVTDFGLVGLAGEVARRPPEADVPLTDSTPLSQDLTRTGAMMGTPSYMAPEQFRGEVVGPAADQFAFCVALHEALYGQRPFAGATFAEVCANVVSGELVAPPRDRVVPSRVARAVSRGLATAPDARYPAMTALLDELAHVPRRRVGVVAAAGGAAVVAAAIAAVALWPGAADACGGGDVRRATAWSPARRVALAQAFGATHRPDAGAVLDRVTAIVDRWGGSWEDAYVGACEDTHVRAIQSEHMLDLRMECLTRQLDDTRATIDLLAAGGGDAVDHAFDAARALPDAASCGDTVALTAAVAPATEATRQAVHSIRDDLARSHARRVLARYQDALAISRPALVAAHATGYAPVVAEALLELGVVEDQVGDHAAADTLRDAMYAATTAGETQVAIAAAARRINELAKVPGQFPIADELGRVAGAMVERAPESYAMVAIALDDAVGTLLDAEGHADDAKARYERALAVSTKRLGPDAPDTIVELQHLGTLAARTHRFDDARRMFEQVVAVDERVVGPDHPAYATALDDLANLDAEVGQGTNSKALRERALAIRLAALGPEHPDVAQSYVGMGGLASEAGDQRAAKAYFEKALALLEKIYGADGIETVTALGNLGITLSALGDHAGARKLIERARALSEAAYGPDAPRVAELLDQLGVEARSDHRYDDALALFQRAEQIVVAAYGANDPRAVDYAGEIAATLTKLKRYPEARDATARTLAAMAVVYGADSPRMASAYGNYGVLQLRLHDNAGALTSFQKAEAIFEAKLGKDHPAVAMTLVGGAQAMILLSRQADAVPELERAIAIETAAHMGPEQRGEAHWFLAMALVAAPATRARARIEAQASLAAYRDAHADTNARDVEDWLRKHPG